MKLKYRPMAIMGFSSLLVLCFCVYIDDYFSFVSVGLGIVLLLLTVFIRNFRQRITPFFIAAALIISGISFEALTDFRIEHSKNYSDSTVILDATVLDEPEFNGTKYHYVLKCNSIDGHNFNGKIRLTAPQYIDAEPYDKIRLEVKLFDFDSISKDLRLYYHSKGIFLCGYAYNYVDYQVSVISPDKKPIGFYLLKIRQNITDRILDISPNDYGAISVGMLIGNKNYISADTMNSIKKAGVAPVFAVSGMHLSVWVMGLYSILELLKIKKRTNSVIGMVFTLFFMTVTGFTPSVCRAGIMLILILCGNLFYKKADSVNSLGFAALVLSVINPLIVADIGFLLSFSSTLGIVTLAPWFTKHIISKVKNGFFFDILKSISEMIFVSVSATFASLGFVIIFIGYISVYSILSNFLISYAASFCMFFGGLAAIFYPMETISKHIGLIYEIFAKYIIFIIDRISKLPFSTINTSNNYWKYGAIVFYIVLILFILLFNKKLSFKFSAVSLSVIILTNCLLCYYDYSEYSYVKILSTDDTIAAVICEGGNNAVICSEGDYKYLTEALNDALEGNSQTTNIFVSDIGMDSSSSVYYAIRDLNPKKVIVPKKTLSLTAVSDNYLITNNANIKLWKNSQIYFVSNSKYSVANCTVDGVNITMILRGKDVPKKYLNSDILVGTHVPNGSQFSNVIISGESTVENALSTEENGEMIIKIKKDKYKIIVGDDT